MKDQASDPSVHSSRRPVQPAHLREWRVSRLALAHPLTLGSVALLAVNDHVLKRLAPSALTGKLSDFAGLFFFPYLLIAFASLGRLALSALRSRSSLHALRRRKAAPFASLAFLGTAALFAIIKAVPAANAASSGLLAVVLRVPLRVTRDATDLAALAALVPSYLLWRSLNQHDEPSPRRSILALGLASLAALATSPCMPFPEVSRVLRSDEGLYAVTQGGQYTEATGFVAQGTAAYLSIDQGLTWTNQPLAEVAPSVQAALQAEVELPKVACVPGREQVCYRISGEESVEVSTNGGAAWETVWSVPASRRSYMSRYAWWQANPDILACLKSVDMRAVDLAILGEGDDHLAVVALRSEGVLLGRLGDSEWEVRAVGLTEPTPFHGTVADLFPPWTIIGETVVAFLVGGLSFLVLSALSWRRLERGRERPLDEPSNRRPWFIAAGVLLFLWAWIATDIRTEIPMLGIPVVILVMLGMGFRRRWARAARTAASPAEAQRLLRTTALASVLVAGFGWLPFALWVLGPITWYGAAVMLAVATAGFAFVLGVRRIRQPMASPEAKAVSGVG
jgi:hypothetical protein